MALISLIQIILAFDFSFEFRSSLQDGSHLKVKTSTLDGAGEGLFTTEALPANNDDSPRVSTRGHCQKAVGNLVELLRL